MKNKKSKKFDSKFSRMELEAKLSGFYPMLPYSFTKRNNPLEYTKLLSLLPARYVMDRAEDLEFTDLIYSGSTTSPFILTIMAGRNDVYQGQEKIDIDVFNIAPNTSSTDLYFLNQCHHFKDEQGRRTSYVVSPYIINDLQTKKDTTYSVFLTGSTYFNSFDDYISQKPDFFEIHTKSFGDIKW